MAEFEKLDRSELINLVKKCKSKNGQLSDQISQMKVLLSKMDQSEASKDSTESEPAKKKKTPFFHVTYFLYKIAARG
mgnify:CR=1 FL=1